MILTPEKIESIERCYFAPSYNLTKIQLIETLIDLEHTKHNLVSRYIPPRKVVGGGHKNGRKVAMNWLSEQIATTIHLLHYFDSKNQTR